MFVQSCVYVCTIMCVCLYNHVCMFVQSCVYVCTIMCVCLYNHVCMFVQSCVYVCTIMCVCLYNHVCMFVQSCMIVCLCNHVCLYHYVCMFVRTQEVDEELEGECLDFEAVPGHGLKCTVSGVEAYTHKTEWRYSKLISREVCPTSSAHNLMVRDIEMGAASRKYKVGGARNCLSGKG